MFDLIELLREKPDRTKKRIAFLIAFTFAGIIFVIWLSVIYPDFIKKQSKEDAVSKLEPDPISSFTETFSSGVSAIGEQFTKLKSSISIFSSSPEHYSATTSESISSGVSSSTPE